jgi:glycosyltransferase involved in cell wall biosynthesis
MQILFIHQNIPGQFKHLIRHFVGMRDVQVWALGEARRVKENWRHAVPGLNLYGYTFNEETGTALNAHLRTTDTNLRRGLAVAKSLETLKTKGLNPDVVFGHPGWGEMLFVRDAFPRAKIVNYCEFYFNSEGQDLGFDPEFPERQTLRYDVRAQNMTQSQSLLAGDLGISPMHWQRDRYPEMLRSHIDVVFDGIDCDVVKPDLHARFSSGEGQPDLSSHDEVITFVNRNLEPLRGFHVFMRALPALQRRRPNAHIVIVGGDGASYSRAPAQGTYRQLYSKEIEGRVDWSRIHFVGRIPYSRYLGLLQISTAHVYLSYPFVLSWSMLEAMAAGCVVIASDTAPVREVIRHTENGLLVDFFDQAQLIASIEQACMHRAEHDVIRRRARQDILDRYDLRTICLPKQKALLLNLGG